MNKHLYLCHPLVLSSPLTEELHMKRVAAKFVPRLLSECIECAAVSHEKRDDKGFTPPLLPGPGNLRFFPVSKNEEGP